MEFRNGASDVSQWPEGLAMASTADVQTCYQAARTAAKEYRALGITTALGPQIDLGSDPRWFRIRDAFGADVELDIALARSYCDGLQTTEGSEDGWGQESVIAMAKHWPGGGTGEGAMKLGGKTKSCAAIMPYYTISWEQDTKNGENVGNSYSEYLIKDLLLDQYKFDGVVCTDWGITRNQTPHVGMYVLGGKCHGVEHLPEEERILKLLLNGVNQIGGLDEREKVDLEKSLRIVGCWEFTEAGFRAQEQSVVLLKNKNSILPLKEGSKVYIPNRHVEPHYNFVRFKTVAEDISPVKEEELAPYFEKTNSMDEADAAIVFIQSPAGRNGYEFNMMNREAQPDMGYYPISLQYRPYTAKNARKTSLAGGDPREEGKNRSYYGKTEITANASDLELVLQTREQMPDKPVIVVVRMDKPAVLAELEAAADAIVVDFGVQKKAIFRVLTGKTAPRGQLPVILPADMEIVEQHCEDVVTDIEPYVDSEGNCYGLGFGLHDY